MSKKGIMIVNVEPFSIEETKLKSREVINILKEKFKMEEIRTNFGAFFDDPLMRYTIIFDTKDHALEAANWLNETLKIGSKTSSQK